MTTTILPDYAPPRAKKILLLYGGTSGEHEVSCASAQFIFQNLQQCGFEVFAVHITQEGHWYLTEQIRVQGLQPSDKPVSPLFTQEDGGSLFLNFLNQSRQKIEFVFSIIHGTGGEDGRMQGTMEFFHIPFAGASMISSALCMDKGYMRHVFAVAQIPQVKYLTFFKNQLEEDAPHVRQEIEARLPYPVFVKPCNMGSSVGVHKVHNQSELLAAMRDAFRYDFHVIVEEGKNVREFEVAVLGNYPHYQFTHAGEVISHHEFYSYHAKYIDENGASLKLPAEIENNMQDEIWQVAEKSFLAVQGDGFARIDIFWDKDEEKAYINEINTLPGFTKISMFPKLWQMEGLPSTELMRRIISLGEEKWAQRKKLITRYSP